MIETLRPRPLGRLAGLLAAAVLLAACGGGPAPAPTKSAAAPTTAPAPAAKPAESKPAEAAKPAASPAAEAAKPAASPGAAASPAASPAAAPAKPSGPLEVVNAAVGDNFNHVPSYVGVEKGIFVKHGIDLKLKILSSGQEMSRALQAGEAQFIGAAVSNTPLSREAGMPVVGIVGKMHDATNPRFDEIVTIIGRSDRGLQAGRPETLVGKKLGTIVGGTGDQYLGVLLKQLNIGRDKVEILNVAPGNWQSAIQTGNVDAVIVWEPYVTQILEKVPGLVTVKKGGGLIGYFIMYSTDEKTIKEKPDLVKRFVTALAESQLYTRKNLDEAAEISTRWIKGLDLEVAKKAIRNMPYDPRISKYSIQNYDEAVQDLLDQKKLRVSVSSREAINSTFIDQVLKERPDLVADLKPIP